MRCLQTCCPLADYLCPSPMIDFDHAVIQDFLTSRRAAHLEELNIVRAAFEFVRDEIAHSWDVGSARVTARASDVLRAGEGICYAKSTPAGGPAARPGNPGGADISAADAGGYAGKRTLRARAEHRLLVHFAPVDPPGRSRQQAWDRRPVFDRGRTACLSGAPGVQRVRLLAQPARAASEDRGDAAVTHGLPHDVRQLFAD